MTQGVGGTLAKHWQLVNTGSEVRGVVCIRMMLELCLE